MRFSFVAGLGFLALAGCVTPSQPGSNGAPTGTIQVQPNTAFDISVGQEARVVGSSMAIRFRAVTDDSRCPSDVQCVWAGNAIAQLRLTSSGQPAVDASLNTTLEPKAAQYAGYTVKLTGLKPVPLSGKPIPAGDYVATLEVTR